MKFLSRFAALSLCVLALSACGSSTSTSTAGAGDATGDGVNTADLTSVDGATPADGSADTGGPAVDAGLDENAACCAAKKATCGFVTGCKSSCGQCGTQKCDVATHKCVPKPIDAPKKKLGEACGVSKDCPFPKLQVEVDAYTACLNTQCESGVCNGNLFSQGVCSVKGCVNKDEVNNVTGDKVPDGVEDPGTSADCGGAVDGPAGAKYRCVELQSAVNVQKGQSYTLCLPGTNFKPCKADSECPADESCGFGFVYGTYGTYCQGRFKSPGGKPGAGASEACNNGSNPNAPVVICANNFCQGQCLGFCKVDDDCITSKGACAAGKCAGSGASCKGDADCSSQHCALDQTLYSNVTATFGLCKAKKCALDADCTDSNFFCNPTYNGVKDPNGDPDPLDKTKVKLPAMENTCLRKYVGGAKGGALCDPFPYNSAVLLKTCENATLCQAGVCGNTCGKDADCPKDMRCGINNYPEVDPTNKFYDREASTGVCTPAPGVTNDCLANSECKNNQICRAWKYSVDLPAENSKTVQVIGDGGMCINDDKALLAAGAQCGQDSGDATCKSNMCLRYLTYKDQAGNQLNIGNCLNLCNAQASCGKGIDIDTGGGKVQNFPAFCSSVWYTFNGLNDSRDRTLIPICRPVNPGDSFADCSATKTCKDPLEFCLASPIVTGPDKAPTKIEYLCVKMATDQTSKKVTQVKKVGETCAISSDPAAPAPNECLSGSCGEETATKGYCEGLCSSDSDCGNGTVCDLKHQAILRKDITKSAIVPTCVKKKSCIPCNFDGHCHSDYKCTTASAGDKVGSCAPPCTTDDDCAKSDGGSKCEPAKSATGAEIVGVKVCTPNCK